MRARLIDVLPWLRSIRPLLTLVDPVAVAVSGLVIHQHVSVLSVGGAAVAGTIVCRGADLHRSRLVLSVLEDMPKLLLAAIVAALTLVGIAPLDHLGDRPSWVLMAVFAGTAFALLVLLRAGAYAVTHSMRRTGRSSHPVIIVGAGVVGCRLAEAFLNKPEYGLVPVGIDRLPPRRHPPVTCPSPSSAASPTSTAPWSTWASTTWCSPSPACPTRRPSQRCAAACRATARSSWSPASSR